MSDRLSRYDSFKASAAGPVHSEKLPEGTVPDSLLAGDPLVERCDIKPVVPLDKLEVPKAPEVPIEGNDKVDSWNEYQQARTTIIVPAASRSRRSLILDGFRWRSIHA